MYNSRIYYIKDGELIRQMKPSDRTNPKNPPERLFPDGTKRYDKINWKPCLTSTNKFLSWEISNMGPHSGWDWDDYYYPKVREIYKNKCFKVVGSKDGNLNLTFHSDELLNYRETVEEYKTRIGTDCFVSNDWYPQNQYYSTCREYILKENTPGCWGIFKLSERSPIGCRPLPKIIASCYESTLYITNNLLNAQWKELINVTSEDVPKCDWIETNLKIVPV